MKYFNTFIRQASSTSIGLLMILIMTGCTNVADETREYGWFEFVIPDLDSTVNVTDMSFLNEEVAGESGFITVKDGHFIDGNGNRIRFFGTNLTFGNCFPDKVTATRFAARLQKLGMNVVRFHHMDNRSAPGGIWNKEMNDLDSGQMEKLDWLIFQLKQHGIYSNLNTHVSRNYPGLDNQGIEQFNYGKTIDHFYRPYIDFQKDYAGKLLTHRNPYTGTTYSDEPAIAFVEINNENSLLSSWALLPNLNNEYKSALVSQWKTWLNSKPGYSKSVDLMNIIRDYENLPEIRKEMLWDFLLETEMAYAKEMVDHLKNDLKIHALVSESQASYSGVAGIYRETEYADFIDMHAYWEHPRFPNRSWSSTDWLIRNSSMVSDKRGGTLLRFGQHRVTGMPLTISEYDHPAPNFFCAEMYPMLTSVASFQDFDGIYHFTFDGPYETGKTGGFFATAGHPLKQVFIPAGAVLFRMNAIRPGDNEVRLDLPPDTVLDKLIHYGDRLRLHGSNMDRIWEDAGAPNALIMLHRMSVNMVANELKLSEPVQTPEGPWQTETGEVVWDNRDSVQAVFKINAPSAKAAIGYIGGMSIDLGNVTIAMDTTPYNWAAITLTALDGKPVEESEKILLVAAGRIENTNMGWNADRTTVGDQWGTAPTRAEGIPAKLTFRDMDKFIVHALDSAGNPRVEIKVKRKSKELSFGIGAQYRTLWYILRR